MIDLSFLLFFIVFVVGGTMLVALVVIPQTTKVCSYCTFRIPKAALVCSKCSREQ